MSPSSKSIRTPLHRAIGLGSAKDGVGHWWAQRLTALALIALAPMFVIPFAQTLGDGHAAVLALYRQPYHALVAMLFIAVMFRHLALGLQVVIEDYVHAKPARMAMLVANTFGCWLFGAAGLFSVLKIALGA